jgi:hypothetical protein
MAELELLRRFHEKTPETQPNGRTTNHFLEAVPANYKISTTWM